MKTNDISPVNNFDLLSDALAQALDNKDYPAACKLSLKQMLLVNKFAAIIATNASDEDKLKWQQAYDRLAGLNNKIEGDIKTLNNQTKNALKRLKGYGK